MRNKWSQAVGIGLERGKSRLAAISQLALHVPRAQQSVCTLFFHSPGEETNSSFSNHRQGNSILKQHFAPMRPAIQQFHAKAGIQLDSNWNKQFLLENSWAPPSNCLIKLRKIY